MSALDPDLRPYDAILLVSFGGPEGPEEVMPFLRQVTGGRGIPDERLAEVAEHYHHFGGRSPINDQCRALLAALRAELDARGIDVPLAWGNRNSAPWLADTVAELAAAGHRRIVALTTSAYPSYSSCRQYRENLADALAATTAAGGEGLVIDRVPNYAVRPGFVEANVDAVVEAWQRLRERLGADGSARLLAVTHSIPDTMAATSGPGPEAAPGEGAYVEWHERVLAAVAERVAERVGEDVVAELTYCSRSGPPSQPWLEPDVNDRLRELHADGLAGVVLAPIGFVSDHMEVVFDLDTEAVETASELGLALERAGTVGTRAPFVESLVDALEERAALARGHDVTPAVVDAGPSGCVDCGAGCCPNLRDPGRPAVCSA